MKKKNKQILRLITQYYDPKRGGSYSGNWKILAKQTNVKANKKTKQKLESWLQKQESYTLHRPIIRQYKRRRVITLGIGHIFGVDLMDMVKLKKWNKGMSYILVVIDMFSKKLDLKAIKNKTPTRVTEAFDFILNHGKTWGGKNALLLPRKVSVDAGGEFKGAFRKYLDNNNIHLYVSKNPDTKVSICERVIRTIRSKLYRYFTHKKTQSYLDVLPKLVQSYNATYHTSIKMTPNQVTYTNQKEVRKNLYGTTSISESFLNPNQLPANRKLRSSSYEYSIGTFVRISKYKGTFRKGYTPNFTTEIFKIIRKSSSTNPKKNRVLYTLTDVDGNIIKGRFYAEELTPATLKNEW